MENGLIRIRPLMDQIETLLLANQVKSELRIVKKILDCHTDLFNEPTHIEVVVAWLREHLEDPRANHKKRYSNQYINNLCNSVRRGAEAFNQPLELSESQAAAFKHWRALLPDLQENLKFKSDYQKGLRNCWAKFEIWLTSSPVLPESFGLNDWRSFREWTINRPELKHTTATHYLHCLKVALQAQGFSVSQKKETRVFVQEIEKQIQAVKSYALATRDYFDEELNYESHSENFESLITGQIKPNTWLNYEQVLRLYTDFHRNKIEQSKDLSLVFNGSDVNEYLKHHQKAYSIETARSHVSTIIVLAKYLYAAKLGQFKNISDVAMKGIIADIRIKKKKCKTFRSSTVKKKRELKPLPDYAVLYSRIEKKVALVFTETEGDFESIRHEARSEERDDRLLNQANKIRNLLQAVLMLHFSCRPEDLCNLIVIEEVAHPITGEILPKNLYKSEYGDWILKYKPSKTDRIDKTMHADRRVPWVYFAFPPRWVSLLESYLKKYRPLLANGSPLLLPSDPRRRKTHQGYLIGARPESHLDTVYQISERLYGERLSENDFRSMLQTYLTSCDLDHVEGLITGHIQHGKMSQTARDHYANLSDYVIHKKSKRFYEVFFNELEEAKKVLSVAHRKKPA